MDKKFAYVQKRSFIVKQLQLIVDKFLHDALRDEPYAPILAGVSGGVDSMVLMHLLWQSCKRSGRRLAVVHVNHGLRETAERDEKIVEHLCKDRLIPFYCRRIENDWDECREGGIEATARVLRYKAFSEIAYKIGARHIVLAHHGGDQVETFLWRFLRGASRSGLSGIRPVSERDGLRILRPLLSVRKQELYAYAKANSIPYGYDETNDDVHYTRNYLRKQVVPVLEQIQPDLIHITERITSILREEDEFLNQLANDLIEKTVKKQQSLFYFSTNAWQDVAVPLQRRAIHILLYCFASFDWGYAHVEAIVQLIANVRPSARVSLPGGIGAWREYDKVCIGTQKSYAVQVSSNTWVLSDGSTFSFGNGEKDTEWIFTCKQWRKGDPVRVSTQYELHIPMYQTLTIQRANTSIRMRPIGLHGTKKVQDIFTDCKIPKQLRTSWPALYIDEGLIWLPGLARSELGKIEAETETGWCITARPPNFSNLHVTDMGFGNKT
jgi:tRNA(Ile)-lysidine synthase